MYLNNAIESAVAPVSFVTSTARKEAEGLRQFEKEDAAQEGDSLSPALQQRLFDIKSDKRRRYLRELQFAEQMVEFTAQAVGEATEKVESLEALGFEFFSEGTSEEEKEVLSQAFVEVQSEYQRVLEGAVFSERAVLQASDNSPLVSLLVGPTEYSTTFEVDFEGRYSLDPAGQTLADEGAFTVAIEKESLVLAGFEGEVVGYRQGIAAQKALVKNSVELFGGRELTRDQALEDLAQVKQWVTEHGGGNRGRFAPTLDALKRLTGKEEE